MSLRRGVQSREEKAQEEQAKQYRVWGLIGLGTVAVLLMGFLVYRSFSRSGFVGREVTSAEVNIKKIAYIYTQYTSAHRGKPPANVDDLKAWVRQLPKEKQKDLGVEDVEQAFTSPRDNQPYVVVPMGLEGMKPDLVVAYEKTGAGGKRWGVSGMGSAWEIADEYLKYHVPGMK